MLHLNSELLEMAPLLLNIFLVCALFAPHMEALLLGPCSLSGNTGITTNGRACGMRPTRHSDCGFAANTREKLAVRARLLPPGCAVYFD